MLERVLVREALGVLSLELWLLTLLWCAMEAIEFLADGFRDPEPLPSSEPESSSPASSSGSELRKMAASVQRPRKHMDETSAAKTDSPGEKEESCTLQTTMLVS